MPEPILDPPGCGAPETPRPDLPAPDLGLPDLAACRLALVGNAPGIGDHAGAIDAAERVVRFNNAPGMAGGAGSRVDLLALVNRGGQMRAWLDDPGFLDRPAVRAARTFLLPFPALPPEDAGLGEGACWTREARARLGPLGLPIRVLPEALHAEGRRRLAPAAGIGVRPNPSTGFLVALAILLGRSAGAPPVDVYGFGFAGWPGHPWAAERRWFSDQEAAGRLRLHPPALDA